MATSSAAAQKTAALLNLGEGLSLPAEDALESVFAVIGKRGRGKTGFVRVMMEEMCRLDLPFVAFDPVGIIWGLRSSFDGLRPGHRVVVVGGAHGDLPLDRRAGADVARAIIRTNVSAVLDLSQEPKAAYRQFVREFSDCLFSENNRSRHVFVEEAPELIPQRLRSDMAPTFEAVERLASRGRNRGIGVTLISQRSATVNKDVLACADHLVCFGVTMPTDRKALKDWVEAKAADDRLREFFDGLASLKRQEGWFWSPESLELFQRFRTHRFTTFHPDRTHLRRENLLDVVAVKADVSDLVARIGPLLPSEEADGDSAGPTDARRTLHLRRRISELEGELTREKARTAAIPAALRKAVREAVSEAASLADRLTASGHRLDEALRGAAGEPALPVVAGGYGPIMERRPSSKVIPEKLQAAPTKGASQTPTDRILHGLGQLLALGVENPTRVQAAIWAGYTPKTGTINTLISACRTKGLIDYPDNSRICLTTLGRDRSDAFGVAQPTQADLDAALTNILDGPHDRIVTAAMAAWPESISRDDLATRSGYTPRTGTFNTVLSRVRAMGLVDYVGKNEVRAEDILFVPKRHRKK